MEHIKYLFALVLFIPIVMSCSQKSLPSSTRLQQFKSPDGQAHYSDLNYWAAHPWKWDPSDSISSELKNDKIDSSADVFFIYPTSLLDDKYRGWNAAIDDSTINNKTDYSSILYQASIFNSSCRIFSPRYRQAHIKSFYTADTSKAIAAFDTAYADIKNAFTIYLSTWNKGKPIVIASHSQGTVHAKRLLKDFFEGKDLQNQLVCAYLIGMPVDQTYFEKIPICNNPASTGCIISWRTFKKGYTEPNYVAKEKFKSIVVNPLTWKTDTVAAPASLNSGGVLQNFNKIKKGVVNAQVHQNVLWTSKPKFFGNIFLTENNYHIGDYNLFYTNIRQNVKDRIASFLLK